MKSMQSYSSMVILLSAICISFAQPQPPELLWHATYLGIHTEAELGGTAFDLISLPDNSFVMTANVIGRRPSESGLWLSRIDSAGGVIWDDTIRFQDRYGEGNEARRICITDRENLAVVGRTNLNGNLDVMFVLADTSGEVLLKQTYGNAERDQDPVDLCQAEDGGFAIIAQDWSANFMNNDRSSYYWLTRTDEDGNELWSRTYGPGEPTMCDPDRILPLADGGFILIGNMTLDYADPSIDFPAYVVRTDSAGEVVWENTYMFQGIRDPIIWGILPDGGDEFVVAVSSLYLYLIWIDGQGEVTYVSDEIQDPPYYSPGDFVRTTDGGYAISGGRLQVIRTDSDGNELYRSTYSDSLDRVAAFTISTTSDSGYCLGGRNWDEGGAALWRLGPEKWPNAVRESSLPPQEFVLYPAYPNPFNAATTVSFSLPDAMPVKLAIYDLQGRQVALLADGPNPAGVHRLTWDANAVLTGVYFLRMKASGFNGVQRVVLIK